MNENNGFIILNRKMLNWGWYKDTNTVRLFIHCLFKANWKDGEFQGITIPRGSFVTSLSKLSEELSTDKDIFTIRNVRTAIKHLETTGEITSKSYSKFRVITINNYDKYQDLSKVLDKQATSKRQASDKHVATIENNKDIKTLNNISTTTTNKQSLFELIEKNFGRTLNPIEIEELSKWEDNELTRYVIKKSILSNVYSIRYIGKVLYTYNQKGIKTVADAEKEYQKFEKEKNSKSNKQCSKSGMQKFHDTLDEWERKMAEEEKKINDYKRNT